MRVMPGTSTLSLRAQAAGVDIAALLRKWRAETPPASYEEITYRLRNRKVVVSSATVARWAAELGLLPLSPKAVAARRNAETEQEADQGLHDAMEEVVAPFVTNDEPVPESAYERELRISRENS